MINKEKVLEKIKNEVTAEGMTEDMFIGFNENGDEQTFYKLLEFDSKETGKHYMAYTDNTTDENGNLKAYGSIVTMDGELMKLEPIPTEKEWKVIEVALDVLQGQGGTTGDEEN